jgi:hypothetical protein
VELTGSFLISKALPSSGNAGKILPHVQTGVENIVLPEIQKQGRAAVRAPISREADIDRQADRNALSLP